MPAKKAKKNSSNAMHSQSIPLPGTQLRENGSKSFEHSLKDATSTYVFKRTAFLSKFRRGHNVDDEISNKDMRSTHNRDNPTSGRRRPLVSSSVLKFPSVADRTSGRWALWRCLYIYIYRQVKVLSSQQRISPEGSQTDSQPKLEGQIYTQLSRNKH